jgi:nitrate/TMAO reductase-like tetraheme cytochrome c subunit
MTRQFMLAAAAVAALTAAALAPPEKKPWELKPPAPAVALKPAKLARLDGQTCGECHADVVEEWAGTAHAIAWVDEEYKEEVADKTRPQSCYGCHIPKPILAAGLPARAEARTEAQHLGISCESCHLGPGGAMLGPWGATTSAHRSELSEHMTEKASSAMCALCHSTNIGPVVGVAKDFVSSKMEERGKSCIACHMAPLERKPSKGAMEGAPVRAGRSHAIQTPRDPAFLALAFEPTLRIEGGQSVVSIRNGAGHRVPGLIGRRIEFLAEVLGADGKVLGQLRQVLDARAYLPVDQSMEIAIDAVGAAVRLRGLHHDPRRNEPVEFLNVRLEPSGR